MRVSESVPVVRLCTRRMSVSHDLLFPFQQAA